MSLGGDFRASCNVQSDITEIGKVRNDTWKPGVLPSHGTHICSLPGKLYDMGAGHVTASSVTKLCTLDLVSAL